MMRKEQEERDILVDIPDSDLPELLELYEKHKETIPHIYSAIFTGIQWRKKKKEKYLRFMSPNNCWREDGTFFVILMLSSCDILFFSFDETGKTIYEAIMKTKIFDNHPYMNTSLLFFSVHYKFHPIVSKAIEDRELVKDNIRRKNLPNYYMFNIPKEEALKFSIDCPPEVYIKELDKSHANRINSIWPHRYPDSEKFISLLLELNGGYGVFLKSTNELVAWVLLSMMGQLSMLQTLDEHKKKGYGSLLTKYMSRELAKKGYNPFGTVVAENYPSVSMFEKLGFKNMGIATYIHIASEERKH